MLRTSTLRPGLLVSLKTSIQGNVEYRKRDIEAEYTTESGEKRAVWETERTVRDPEEHERAIKVRGKARSFITGICSASSFGLLCPEAKQDELDKAIEEARRIISAFNGNATMTRVSLFVIAGRVAPDDVEAVRAINSEIRDLLTEMEAGVQNLDVKVIREAANKAKAVGAMLTGEAYERVEDAIKVARSCARQLVKAGEQAAVEVDQVALKVIASSRTAFLDLDESGEIADPQTAGRAIDFEPTEIITFNPTARLIEMED